MTIVLAVRRKIGCSEFLSTNNYSEEQRRRLSSSTGRWKTKWLRTSFCKCSFQTAILLRSETRIPNGFSCMICLLPQANED